MSGVEVIAVVACVAASKTISSPITINEINNPDRQTVVSAYSDGASMFTAIRKKYHERQSTQKLERSLERGRTDIESRFNQYRQELGWRYEEGDAIAREQMKDIIIKLQGALLRHLREAQDRGTTLDLMALQRESDQDRADTMLILGGLYQRLSRPSFPLPIDPTSRRMASYGHEYSLHGQDRYSLSHSSGSGYISGYPVSPAGYLPGQFLPDVVSASPTDTLGPSRDYEATNLTNRPQSLGLGFVVSSMGDLFHPRPGRTPSLPVSSPEPMYIPQPVGSNPGSPSMLEPIPQVDIRPATSHRPKLRPSSIPHDVLWGNPWEHESLTDSDSDYRYPISCAPLEEEENNHLSPILPSTQPRQDSLSATSTVSTDSTPSNPSTGSSTDRSTQAIRPLWPPSKTNNYLGFCKGAWKVHVGFRGFKIYTEPGTGYYTQQSWLRCTKCAFEAPMVPKSSSSNPQFEKSVRTHKASGIRYRFEFLAKSHVPCKRDPASDFTPNTPRGTFCCVFCCALAQSSTRVYGNLDIFMAHLAEQHWTVEKGALAVLSSMRCVVGRVAPDSEYFDVNIVPVRG
ncbi:uncharacterized protein N7518_004364 [Penicillium psychrosexuale]|uniref:uncharacterized protein n=1 Tax=Penicillium psychrosexuale TaxID=1002107 RepID=UPI0025454B20|nr:uncharacterized protein N7518_004364 [Penicillium psychrosexuale]KAJ5795824.1 hypothetical protein N7518_004364 [Penicillium psychrosexuale]